MFSVVGSILIQPVPSPAGLGGVALEQPGEEADGGQPQRTRRSETILEEAKDCLATIMRSLLVYTRDRLTWGHGFLPQTSFYVNFHGNRTTKCFINMNIQ